MPTLKDAYLLVVRQVDPQVFGYYNRTKLAVSEYDRLDQNRSELQLVFAALYAVVSLVTLLGAVWGGESTEQVEYLRVFVAQLRKKLEPSPNSPRYIVTDPWVGYRFEPGD